MYDYLKKYIGYNDLKGVYFLPVNPTEIKNAEKKGGILFPSELKKFYKEIGEGILSCGEKYPEMLCDYVDNKILPPDIAVAFMQGHLLHPDSDHYMSQDTYEDLAPDDLPFFEISDSSSFMTMKLDSMNPNAVWFMGAEKIEDSFATFIYKLYHEGPDYYSADW